MFLAAWLESIGLSLELVIIVGALVFVVLIALIHYWKRIVLLFAPLMGDFGKSLQARWRKPKTDQTPS
jgi:undecaprenyl-diphosphatase